MLRAFDFPRHLFAIHLEKRSRGLPKGAIDVTIMADITENFWWEFFFLGNLLNFKVIVFLLYHLPLPSEIFCNVYFTIDGLCGNLRH